MSKYTRRSKSSYKENVQYNQEAVQTIVTYAPQSSSKLACRYFLQQFCRGLLLYGGGDRKSHSQLLFASELTSQVIYRVLRNKVIDLQGMR